ncbi:hypothetical protein FGG08_002955 [Glutinoglossum americanum]|uniref:Uncharacterized protein n=1 Tax=Glutinoglossum americanum TaxID=1670608 RepID=A0A9P8L407_9PEZI|nr:hypothetical protein FGG08_002955 [Glutinoglossum americanum]
MANLAEGTGAPTLKLQTGPDALQFQPNTEIAARPRVSPIQIPSPRRKKGDGPQYEFSTEPEICTSPSWSDFGGGSEKKEKKRVEKERKELEKKLKKEKEREEKVAKASRRLSKMPPLAKMGIGRGPIATDGRSSISSERPTEPQTGTASSKTSIEFPLQYPSLKGVSLNSSASSLEPGQRKPFRQISPTSIGEPTPPSTRPNSSTDTSPTLPPSAPHEPHPPNHRYTPHHPSSSTRPNAAGSRSTWAAGKVPPKQPSRPLGKCFFICCGCLRWHDLPADIFEKIVAKPSPQRKVSDPTNDSSAIRQHEAGGPSLSLHGKQKAAAETASSVYPCPWCDHEMNSDCCASWTTVVYFHTRHH